MIPAMLIVSTTSAGSMHSTSAIAVYRPPVGCSHRLSQALGVRAIAHIHFLNIKVRIITPARNFPCRHHPLAAVEQGGVVVKRHRPQAIGMEAEQACQPVAKISLINEVPVSNRIGIAKGKFNVYGNFDSDNEEISDILTGGSL